MQIVLPILPFIAFFTLRYLVENNRRSYAAKKGWQTKRDIYYYKSQNRASRKRLTKPQIVEKRTILVNDNCSGVSYEVRRTW